MSQEAVSSKERIKGDKQMSHLQPWAWAILIFVLRFSLFVRSKIS